MTEDTSVNQLKVGTATTSERSPRSLRAARANKTAEEPLLTYVVLFVPNHLDHLFSKSTVFSP